MDERDGGRHVDGDGGRALLATDLDGTLIPTVPHPRHLEAVSSFAERAGAHRSFRLAYVTGRHRALAERGLDRFGLPWPDFLVCDVGTSVYVAGDGSLTLDAEYRSRMREAMAEMTGAEVRSALAGIPGLLEQPEEKQAEFKASFDFAQEARDRVLAAVRDRIGDWSLALVASVDPDSGVGLLDVLPAGVAKDTAVEYLRIRLELSPAEVYYAGDSGNDAAAMLRGYRTIVVGNAPEELKTTLRTEAIRRGLGDHLYFARRPYAAGVLEGSRHWGLLSDESS